MPTTAKRRKNILEILEANQVKSQAELSDLLGARGFKVTQPVLSRDLRALNVAKRAGVYQPGTGDRVTPLEKLQSLLRGAKTAGNHMVVVACEPGAASAVARALEAEGPDGLVGTVAGDDTVLTAVEGKQAAVAIRERVEELLP